ncbi:MAG TPA: rhodanese-like domain-containing protein [Chthoniobacterales bacterium]|nr:rhodanese-like domain-containing protein [Chthoniobacterales bacterium]
MKPGAIFQALLLIAIAAVPAVGEAVYFRDKISWRSRIPASDIVDLDLVRSWGGTVIWVDARPDDEYQADHIPDAISLNEDRWNELLPQFLGQWSPDKKVVVYCSTKSCNLAGDVARRLREEAQMPQVYVLEGGWEEWLAKRR